MDLALHLQPVVLAPLALQLLALRGRQRVRRAAGFVDVGLRDPLMHRLALQVVLARDLRDRLARLSNEPNDLRLELGVKFRRFFIGTSIP